MMNRKGWLLASIVLLMLVVGMIALNKDTAVIKHDKLTPYLPPVSVVILLSGKNQSIIQTYAEVKPRWDTTIRAQISGKIVKVTKSAFSGRSVKKGDLLIRIEDSPFQADLRDAEQAVSEAELSLMIEAHRSKLAQRDWQRSGIGKTPSDLAMNKPQLNLAKKRVSAAQSRLNVARKRLAYTEIRAPFSGMITRRHISIGQSITEGEALIHIIDGRKLMVSISLSQQQWSLLSENWINQTASIKNTSGLEIAKAKIRRGGGFLDPETRQYKLFLEIDDKYARKILPGDFVQVSLPGRYVSNSLMIPESALTRDGYIWVVDNDHCLRKIIVNVIFHLEDRIVVETPTKQTMGNNLPRSWQIATTPLASFLDGMRVKPVVKGKE